MTIRHAAPHGFVVMLLISLAMFLAGCGEAPKPYSEKWKPAPIQTPVAAQSAPARCANPPTASPALLAERGYVQYAVTVTDRSGKPITELSEKDFVLRDGSETVPIRFFRRDVAAPVSIVVVFDSTFSMGAQLQKNGKTKLEFARDALKRLSDRLDRCDEMALVVLGDLPTTYEMERTLLANRENVGNPAIREGFAVSVEADLWVEPGAWGPPLYPTDPEFRKVRLLQPFTTDRQAIANGVNGLQAAGGTPLYDAIADGLQVCSKADYPRRALIVITDGMNNGSVRTIDQVLSEVNKRNAIPIYSLGIGDPTEEETNIPLGPQVFTGHTARWVNQDSLRKLSDGTGGRAFIVSPASRTAEADRAAALDAIAGTLASSYTIGVVTEHPADVRVEVPNHHDAVVYRQLVAKTRRELPLSIP